MVFMASLLCDRPLRSDINADKTALIHMLVSAFIVRIGIINVSPMQGSFDPAQIQASDSMMARPKAIHFSWLEQELYRLLLGPSGLY